MHVRTDARMGCAVREYAMCAWVGASAPVPPPPQQRTHCGLHRDATTWPTARPRSHAHAQREPAAGCVAWRLYIKKSTSADKLTWWWWWVVMVSVARGAMGARNGRPRWTPVPPSHALSACPGRVGAAYMCVPRTHRAAAHPLAPLRSATTAGVPLCCLLLTGTPRALPSLCPSLPPCQRPRRPETAAALRCTRCGPCARATYTRCAGTRRGWGGTT